MALDVFNLKEHFTEYITKHRWMRGFFVLTVVGLVVSVGLHSIFPF